MTHARVNLFRSLLFARKVEERIAAEYANQQMRCPTHFSIGQEAVAAGVCALLSPDDSVISAHRSHAHYLCRGGSLPRMVAELYGKETGCASGRGGSMHLIDLDVNFMGCVPIVGSTIPIGVGIAFGKMMQGEPGLTAVFFGEAATEAGVFHESVNWALVRQLPIIFVCENNLYSVNTPLADRQPKGRSLLDLARGHGLRAFGFDGQEVVDVYENTAPIIQSVRDGEGPVFLEYATYRWLEHCGPNYDTELGFRPDGEFDSWMARDPLTLSRSRLESDGVLTAQMIESFEAEIDAKIDAAFKFANDSPFPPRDSLYRNLYPS